MCKNAIFQKAHRKDDRWQLRNGLAIQPLQRRDLYAEREPVLATKKENFEGMSIGFGCLKVGLVGLLVLGLGACPDPAVAGPDSETDAGEGVDPGDGKVPETPPPEPRYDVEIAEVTLNQGIAVTLYSSAENEPDPGGPEEPSPPVEEPEPLPGAAFGESCTQDADCQTQYCTQFLSTCGEQCESGPQGCAADPNCCPISGADTCFFGLCVAGGGGGIGGGGGGQAGPVDVPPVPGRAGRLNVTLEALPDFQARALEVQVRSGGNIAASQQVELSSAADPARNLRFALGADVLTLQDGLQVQVRELGGDVIAAWPDAGEEVPAQTTSTGTLRVVLVPVQYGGDGSNRLPDMSEAQLQRYADWMTRLYPLQNLELSVRSTPMVVNYEVTTRGWSQFLQDVQTLRNQDRPANDVYYHALIAPADSFETFCGQGCVLGLGILGTVADADSRVSSGVGFTGDVAASTLAHEVGHAHGREHAPCGLFGQPSDPGYPHSEAAIGAVGYDINTNQEIDAARKDIMSYCEPVWVSDYTYAALAERMNALSSQQASLLVQPRSYDVLIVELDGALSRGKKIDAPFVSLERPQVIEFLDDDEEILDVREVPSHRLGEGEGAFLYIAEEAPAKTQWVRYGDQMMLWER